MQTLNMKIYDYDTVNDTIIVSFSSDQSLRPVEEYPRMAFQIHRLEGKDTQSIIKQIAMAGYSIAIMQDQQEQVVNNPAIGEELQGMVGKTLTFPAVDLSKA